MARDANRTTIANLEFLGEVIFPTGFLFDGTVVGGLSGIDYDAATDTYVAISDDRSQSGPARFYTLSIDVADGALTAGDVTFTDVTPLRRLDGSTYPALFIDPEGIAFDRRGNLYFASEGQVSPLAGTGGTQIAPSIGLIRPNGEAIAFLPVDYKFLPTASATSGVRNNLAFESLTVTPNGRYLFTATENALIQDSPAASLASGSLSRIIKYDTRTGLPVAEFAYLTEAVAEAGTPGGFATNGLVELHALDNIGTLLAVERSFTVGAPGTGNTIKLFLVETRGSTDISGQFAIDTEIDDGELAAFLDSPVRKTLLLDLAELGIPLDNIEGVTLGPKLADGRQTLTLVSDNNFSATQFTQILTFAVDLDTTPGVRAKLETVDSLRYDSPLDTVEGPDSDDPAVWLNAADANASIVITTAKEGGLRVYDLAGQELSRVTPPGIRYNNVDILYGVELNGVATDLAVASDRANDTLAIFRIDPVTRALTEISSAALRDPAFSIFGEDDGEATAYGLAAYVSPVDGQSYVFVTQADGAKIAQLRITDAGGGAAGAELVRTLELPVADGDDASDYQSEGITIDRETGIGYVTVEGELGLLAFDAEPTGSDAFTTIVDIDFEGFVPDLEGVAILYGRDGAGALVVSSQGDSSFAVFDRQTYEYVGSFAVTDSRRTDGVEESDGLEIFSGALGDAFPRGLLITHDGSNDPAAVFATPDDEDGEIQNFNTNFKYVDIRQIVEALGIDFGDRDFDPRIVPDALI